MSYATVIQELGYPNNSKTLKYRYREYESIGDLHKAYAGGSKCTDVSVEPAASPTAIAMNTPQISLAVPGIDLKRTRLNAPSTNDDTVHIMNPDAVMVWDNTLTNS